jgi:hypothetical protein
MRLSKTRPASTPAIAVRRQVEQARRRKPALGLVRADPRVFPRIHPREVGAQECSPAVRAEQVEPAQAGLFQRVHCLLPVPRAKSTSNCKRAATAARGRKRALVSALTPAVGARGQAGARARASLRSAPLRPSKRARKHAARAAAESKQLDKRARASVNGGP